MNEGELHAGRATADGTGRFAGRFADLPGHFRAPDRIVVSSMGLGTRSGEPGGVDDLLIRSAVPQLLEGGVNLFATALSDRAQSSERSLGNALGRAFREGAAARDEVVVVTKGGYLTVDPEGIQTYASARRYLVETYLDTGLVDPDDLARGVHCISPSFLDDQIDRSRRNLGLDTLDVYLIEEPELQLQELKSGDAFRVRFCRAFEALERAVSDGRIGAYGLATWDGFLRPHTDRGHLSLLDTFEWALEVGGGDHHLRALQLPYSLANAEALQLDSQLGPGGGTDALLSSLRGTGTLVLAAAPLVQGRALGRLPSFVRDAFPGLHSDAQRCLQFARSTPGIDAAIVGMRDSEHIAENLRMARIPPVGADVIESLFKRGPEET